MLLVIWGCRNAKKYWDTSTFLFNFYMESAIYTHLILLLQAFPPTQSIVWISKYLVLKWVYIPPFLLIATRASSRQICQSRSLKNTVAYKLQLTDQIRIFALAIQNRWGQIGELMSKKLSFIYCYCDSNRTRLPWLVCDVIKDGTFVNEGPKPPQPKTATAHF